VLFLRGSIATNDGTALPNDTLVERICNNTVLQQVYATPRGEFTMQMGSRFDSFVDASGSPGSQEGLAKKASTEGIPRHDLRNCELRASAGGFRSNSINLVDLTPSGSSIDVGAIVVERATKIKGMTLSATPFKAPSNARKAYEKGLEAERKGKLAEARQYFEQALEIYPRYASAWFQLGTVFERLSQKDSARAAYMRATTIDTRFLPPYLSLAEMAYDAGNWKEVLQFTGHIIDRDLLNQGDVAGYVLDLDESNPAEAYFYNAVANYELNNLEEAEKSALKAEHVDLRPDFPQLHLLLADIFAGKKDYAVAISELRAYLELAPHAKDGDQVREQLAQLEKLNHSAPSSQKPVQN
jgi:tetratricopeptide (TPR) repeat protein